MKRFVSIALFLIMGSIPVGSALAEESFTYYGGTVTGGPVFNRPNGGTGGAPPFALSGIVTPYSQQSFQVNATATCFVSSVQNSRRGTSPPTVFDGWIHVYQGSFNAATPLTNIQRGDDDGNLGVGTSETTSFSATANTPYIIVTSGNNATTDVGDFQNTVTCAPPSNTALVITHGACSSDGATRACLNNGRFQVSATFQTPGGVSGSARVVQFGSGDTALLSFFDPQNWEVLVKVLNFCAVNNTYSIFAAGATDVGVVLTVTDTTGAGGTTTITNPVGTPFEKRAIALSACP